MVSGFFVTVLYYPYFWINLAMTVALSTVARQLPVAAPSTLPVGSRVRVTIPTDLPFTHPGFQPVFPRR
jgi:hypothetical protein